MKNIPSWLRASIISTAQTAVALIALAVIDLLLDVQDWVADPTNPVDFSAFGKVVLGALISALVGVVTAIWRKIKPPEATYTGTDS